MGSARYNNDRQRLDFRNGASLSIRRGKHPIAQAGEKCLAHLLQPALRVPHRSLLSSTARKAAANAALTLALPHLQPHPRLPMVQELDAGDFVDRL